MSHERASELAALVAIGAATDVERAELDRLVATDPAAAAELDAFNAVAASFAESLEPLAPPAGGFEALTAAIAGESAGGAPSPFATTPEYAEGGKPRVEAEAEQGAEIISLAARRRQRLLGGTLAISLAAAAAFLFMWLTERDRAADELASANQARDRAQAQVELVRADAQTEIDKLAISLRDAKRESDTLAARFAPFKAPQLTLATMTSKGGDFAHVVAESDGRRWLVVAEGLPDVADDKDYQMWFVPADGKPVSAGLLRHGPGGVMSATAEIPEALAGTKLRPAISLEVKGGAPQPTEVKLIGEPI